jgi:predicted RNA-binding Zn ribbon-like protein
MQIEHLPRVGGRVCLDFANTIEGRAGAQAREYLCSYTDLVTWSRVVGLLPHAAAQGLLVAAAAQPATAARILTSARGLREAIYSVFAAVAARQDPGSTAVAALNQAMTMALAHVQVVRIADQFGWAWREQAAALDGMLWPVACSAAVFLTSPDVERVRECPGDDCNWLFVDDSRNRRRRWCSMQMCGDKVKARRYYARQRDLRDGGKPQGA